jgi:kumamolisin
MFLKSGAWLIGIGFLYFSLAGFQTPPIVPPTDLSKAKDRGEIAHTNYLVQNQQAIPRMPQGQTYVITPDTDISEVTSYEGQLASLPPEQVDLKKVYAHTNYKILAGPGVGPFAAGVPRGETPASIRGVYNVVSGGGSKGIAIVDAFDYPTAAEDLKTFSQTFDVPCDDCLKIVYAAGTKPAGNCAWAAEAALDIEWAHAMAPKAKIILVEANSQSFPDMIKAVDVATNEVTTAGGGVVSLSWGGREFGAELGLDGHFLKQSVVFVAASGDVGGLISYPSSSPNVVGVGGTTIVRDANGVFVEEVGWNQSGGGESAFESKPAYQARVPNTSISKRSAPDLSALGDFRTGAAVYDSTACYGKSGWLVIGGTSLSSPIVAGIINTAGHFAANSAVELQRLYANRSDATKFRDIVKGGPAGANKVLQGYDYVTGIGSPLDSNFDQ